MYRCPLVQGQNRGMEGRSRVGNKINKNPDYETETVNSERQARAWKDRKV